MTSPHEREERDFFDDLSDGAPPQNQAEPLPRNGGGGDPTEEPQAASDPRAAQTEMIRIADHLPPGVGRAGTPTGWRPLGAAALCAAPRPGPGGTGIPAAITRAAAMATCGRKLERGTSIRTAAVRTTATVQLGRRPSRNPRQGRARQPRRRPVGAGPAALAGTAQPWCGAARRAPLR